ncbi:MAG: YdeI/OmpD-associated family protein [Ignavibacteriaceae bacterium]|nr:YdeI/OmpD-associated family protein [Ignavibacterium sp.]MCC6254164.1 YdeI/OmpD-associated family protein [Ignavibacteriaceae bacterium]HRN25866.1 YdeI/OmpD-associated family protein [Ignavibacteriaceae bacterium]HRP92332.1 YdeI/OmpD-associated family protein [Ignavibacteriaceae bacterium]HRQ52809.1 YdeI/OmpD-associated family protein [Ignavibacteriaceae bacterium]
MVNNQIVFFPTQKDLRKWFEKNHKKEKELFAGYYKVSSGKPSITWSQSVDEAICFGWIDGIRRGVDDESYCIRFTPRNPKSNWSAINIKKVEELTKLGLMKPEGLTAFSFRKDEKSEIYSYENPAIEFDKSFLRKFKSNKKAWEYFQSSAPSYKKITTRWVMSAKQEPTRLKRLEELITDSAAGKKIKAMNYGKKK